VAAFERDEKRTYPFYWLAIGGIFAGSSAWAVYAELVTRVPWEKQRSSRRCYPTLQPGQG
jgi:hypothetical protein